jgi:acyl carrier protein
MFFSRKSKNDNIQEKINKFIKNNFPLRKPLDDDDSFIEKGIIDSTGILELVEFIESTFDIEIKDDELIPENLDSVNKIINFINKKKLDKDNVNK